MMIRFRVLAWMCSVAMLASPVQADLRVLFRFDNANVEVFHVLQVDTSTDFTGSTEAGAMAEVADGFILMRWLDSSGEMVASSQVADPRVTHSPNHTDAFLRSQHGLLTGGWMANGPDGAESVIVELPEKSDLGLAAEIWNLPLRGNF